MAESIKHVECMEILPAESHCYFQQAGLTQLYSICLGDAERKHHTRELTIQRTTQLSRGTTINKPHNILTRQKSHKRSTKEAPQWNGKEKYFTGGLNRFHPPQIHS